MRGHKEFQHPLPILCSLQRPLSTHSVEGQFFFYSNGKRQHQHQHMVTSVMHVIRSKSPLCFYKK